jgi:hypothetical protein
VGSQATLGRSYSAVSPTPGAGATFGGRASPGMMFGSGAPAAAPAAPAAPAVSVGRVGVGVSLFGWGVKCLSGGPRGWHAAAAGFEGAMMPFSKRL